MRFRYKPLKNKYMYMVKDTHTDEYLYTKWSWCWKTIGAAKNAWKSVHPKLGSFDNQEQFKIIKFNLEEGEKTY